MEKDLTGAGDCWLGMALKIRLLVGFATEEERVAKTSS